MLQDIIVLVKNLNQAVRKQQNSMAPDSNGRAQGRVLRLISENEGIPVVELARILRISVPTLMGKLTKLEKDQMIELSPVGDKPHKQYIHLTADGRTAHARREFSQYRFGVELNQCLSPEEHQQFSDYCDRILFAIDQMARTDASVGNSVVDFYQEQKKRRQNSTAAKEKPGV